MPNYASNLENALNPAGPEVTTLVTSQKFRFFGPNKFHPELKLSEIPSNLDSTSCKL
jgi:hypothetical protein